MARDNIIPFEPVGRIMESSGGLRVSHEAKIAMVGHLTEYANMLGKLAVKYSEHAGRNTVTDKDLKLAAKFA